MQKLHPRTIYLFWAGVYFGKHARILFSLVFLSIVLIPFYLRLSRERLPTGSGIEWWQIVVVILILIGGGYIWARLFYNSYFYELTEDAIKIEKGVIWKKYISIPYERIQNVDIHRGLLARILGLSKLFMQTAGYAGYAQAEGKLPGLLPENAEKLREELIKRVRGTKQGL